MPDPPPFSFVPACDKGAAVMLCAYLGTDHRSYPDYADAATGRMLQAAPGGVYDVRAAPGRHPGLPLPPGDGRWTADPDVISARAAAAASLEAAGSAADGGPAAEVTGIPPEPPGEPEAAPEPGSAFPSLPGESEPDGGQAAPSSEE